jgi:hypothetical protein
MKTHCASILAVFIAAGLFSTATWSDAGAVEVIPLKGTWRFQLDRDNAGVREKWYERSLAGKVSLPGSLPARGIGDEVSLDTKWIGGIQDPQWTNNPVYAPYTRPGNFKFPFWLQPDKYYGGAAWYQRDLEIPAEWVGKRVVLTLERPHWETRVWLDGREIGMNRSLSTPHVYSLGATVPAGKHQLTIRVDNSMVIDIGENTHGVTDHTQGNWNGIVGNLSLSATAPVWIENLQVFPRLEAKSVKIRGSIGNLTGKAGSGALQLRVAEAVERGTFDQARPSSVNVAWENSGGDFEFELPVPEAKPWDEFSPALYNLEARLEGSRESKVARFGFREISTRGTQILINGRKAFIRGTLECCIFPLTGHPPTEVDAWRRVIQAAKAHGLNLLRFHSYCPPEAAFLAADELGFYLQVETCWPNQSTTLGDGKPVDQWVYDETESILKAYGNHPSFILMAHGNEPGGSKANPYLSKYVDHFKAQDARRLWTSGAGWPQLPENQWHLTPDPRVQAWGGGLKSRINAQPPETATDYRDYVQKRTVPIISHEIGQWCVYPNFDEIRKYRGYLKPRNFEIFRDSLKAHQMGGQARDFLIASGKLQTLCYKEDIESALRTPGMGGFQLLDLHDFPGQGTALIGVLDPFWEYKGYVTAGEFRRFCNPTVPLARLGKRVFTTDESLTAGIEISHFGAQPIPGAVAVWKLAAADGRAVASGRLAPRDVPVDNGTVLGTVSVDLKEVKAPARYQLVVGLEQGGVENDWDVWVYPPRVETQVPAGVVVTDSLNEPALAALKAGGKVLWLIPPGQVKGDRLGKVEIGFSSIFWNTAWTQRQPPHTLGILCDPKHPALAGFPTESHSNWQWWYLVSRSGALILDDLPGELRPTVQVIDDWVTNRKLGLLFEVRVGKGKLMVCSMDLKPAADEDPVRRQMRYSLLSYMGGSKFKPGVEVPLEKVSGLAAP